MGQPGWEADKMLDVYIHDYLIKRNLLASAKTFMTEAKVSPEPVAIDAPGGFLFEWWSVFWDIFISRTNEKHSEKAASYVQAQQLKAREIQVQKEQQQRQLQQQLYAQIRRNGNHPSFNGAANFSNSENLIGNSMPNAMVSKILEERLKSPHQREGFDDPTLKRVGESPSHFLDASSTVLHKTASSPGQPSGPLLQNAAGNVNSASPHGQACPQQIPGNSQGSLVIDSSMFGAHGAMHPKSNLSNPGPNSTVPLNGWPMTGMDQLHPGLLQGPKSFLPSPQHLQQFQLLSSQQQRQVLLQAHSSSLSPVLGETDPRKSKYLWPDGPTVKDGQPLGSDRSQGLGSEMHETSSIGRAALQDQNDIMFKMTTDQQQPSLSQQHLQQQQQLQLQQLQQQQQQYQQNALKGQSGRKRKLQSSSEAANSSGTGNTPCLSRNSAPSTPSAHTPGDVMSMAGTLQHNNSAKNLLMYGSDRTGGLASPSNPLVDIDHLGEDCSLDENVESYISHDGGEQKESVLDTVKSSSEGHKMGPSKGFTFNEVGCLRAHTSKVVCCHFSSDGKLLASAGHDKKAVLWNMDTLKLESTLQEHNNPITDVRFSPNSTHLASSSYDKTVRVWDANNPTYSLRTFIGHSASVNSLDFHPSNGELLCSCDDNSEIRYWSVNHGSCKKVSKGGRGQLRFQPDRGQFIAATTENTVAIIDVEADNCIFSLQRHKKPVHSLCWNAIGDYVASVSEDSVKISSMKAGGRCVQEIACTGNPFQTCVFHPNHPSLLIIGCDRTFEFWNMAENKTMSLESHDALITALAQSPATGMVASASHDKCVKLWK